MKGRTPIGSIVHTTWTNLNIRCANGKYNRHRTKDKCRSYESIFLRFNLEELKQYCHDNEGHILSLVRPSIDRRDSSKDYTIDNIRFIELEDNIRKDKMIAKNGKCKCFKCNQIKELYLMVKDKRRVTGRGTMCKTCDNLRRSSTGV